MKMKMWLDLIGAFEQLQSERLLKEYSKNNSEIVEVSWNMVKMSNSRTIEMDSLQMPPNRIYKIQPMDASHFAPHPDRYADDDEIGLGYQRTLVNTVYKIWIFNVFPLHLCCAHNQSELISDLMAEWICTLVTASKCICVYPR